MSEIKNLNPVCIWKNFHALTQVPRPSGHLEKIQQFLVDFGKNVGVETFIDPAGNVVMRKPASPGMENRKGVILQAHMDMVPQKTQDSSHNFVTDPIETYIDEGWVRAKGTTLGADNGIGVATIMAVMEDKTLVHGPVEGLITADEETGMDGANNLPAGQMQGQILMNLDSESWGHFCIGSAGGINITASTEYAEEDATADTAVKITLKGMKGGHSGLEIHLGRANANKLMARVVKAAIARTGARLAAWHGGNMRNAIPYECETVLTVAADKAEALKALVAEFKTLFESEFAEIEDQVNLTAETTAVPAKQMKADDEKRIVSAILGCHNGVLRQIPSFPSVVETSSNLAIIDIADGKAGIRILARSARESTKEYITDTLAATFELAGFTITTDGSYCGWDPNTKSELLAMLTRVYKEMTGDEAHVVVDHAGLECSIILGKYPDLDVVSFGPTLRSPHTTIERCLIETVAPYWEFVKKALAEVPAK